MPVLVEMRLKATWTIRPDTRQLHGLACVVAGRRNRRVTRAALAGGKPLAAVTVAFRSRPVSPRTERPSSRRTRG